MAECERTPDGSGEGDTEPTRWPSPAVVAALAAEAFELDRSQAAGADRFLVLDRYNLRQAGAALQLLPEHMGGESLRRGVVLGPVALGASELGITRHDKRRGGDPDGRFGQQWGAEILLVTEADEE